MKKRIKRIITELMVLFMCFGNVNLSFLGQINVFADTITGEAASNGDLNTYSFDTETGILTISGQGTIQPVYDDFFREHTKEIIIEEGITGIDHSTFNDFFYVEKISLPASLTYIPEYAFSDCNSLTSLTIDENNPVYDSRDNCNAIIETSSNTLYEGFSCSTIPSSVEHIGSYAYAGGNLKSITIPEGVTSIAEEAFYNCNLHSITIPSTVNQISYRAFSSNPISSITVNENNTTYDSRDNCNAIIETNSNTLITGSANTTIPEGVTAIGDSAFYYCSSLTSLTIPEGVTSIGSSAFDNCISLADITIPEGVTSIEPYTFNCCYLLTDITIPEGVTTIGECAFYNCNSLETVTIQEGVTTIGDSAFYCCSGLTSVTIPTSVTSIGSYAFRSCHSLTDITIPEEVTSIGEYAFSFPTTLHGKAGSYAQQWASDYGVTFMPIDCEEYGLDHVIVTDEAVAPTCVPGLTEGNHCSVCGKVLVAQEQVDPVEEHDVVTIPAVAATSTTIGSTEESYCSECGTVLAQAAKTVIEGSYNGQEEYYQYTPAYSGTLTVYSTSDVDTYGNLYDSNMNQITCDDDSGDGNNFMYSYNVDAGNIYYIGVYIGVGFYNTENIGTIPFTVELTPNDCEEAGLEHTVVVDEAVAPTCAPGLTEGSHCSVCGKVIVAQEQIAPVEEHDPIYSDIEVTSDTIGSEGRVICSKCNSVIEPGENIVIEGEYTGNNTGDTQYFRYIPKTSGILGMNYYYDVECNLYDENMNKIETYSGYNSYPIEYYVTAGETYYISINYNNTDDSNIFGLNVALMPITWSFDEESGVLTVSGENMPEFFHNYCPWYVEYRNEIKDIVIEDGMKSISWCAFLGLDSLESVVIPDSVTYIEDQAFDLEHDFTIVGNTGSYAETFANENNIHFETLCEHFGHDYQITSDTATCTKAGTVTYTCSRCGDSYTEASAAKGHTKPETVTTKTTAATCTKAGSVTETYTCPVCNKKVTVKTTIPALGHDLVLQESVAPTYSAAGYTTELCTRCNKTIKTTIPKLVAISLSKCTVTVTQTESGKLNVEVFDPDGNSVDESCYTVTYPTKLTVGKNATVKVTGVLTEGYTSSKSVKFKVVM